MGRSWRQCCLTALLVPAVPLALLWLFFMGVLLRSVDYDVSALRWSAGPPVVPVASHSVFATTADAGNLFAAAGGRGAGSRGATSSSSTTSLASSSSSSSSSPRTSDVERPTSADAATTTASQDDDAAAVTAALVAAQEAARARSLSDRERGFGELSVHVVKGDTLARGMLIGGDWAQVRCSFAANTYQSSWQPLSGQGAEGDLSDEVTGVAGGGQHPLHALPSPDVLDEGAVFWNHTFPSLAGYHRLRSFVCSVYASPNRLVAPLWSAGIVDGSFVGQFQVPIGVGTSPADAAMRYAWFDVLDAGRTRGRVLVGVQYTDDHALMSPARPCDEACYGDAGAGGSPVLGAGSTSALSASFSASGPSALGGGGGGGGGSGGGPLTESWMVEALSADLQLTCYAILARVYCSRDEAEMARAECVSRARGRRRASRRARRESASSSSSSSRQPRGATGGDGEGSEELLPAPSADELVLVQVADFCYPRPVDCMHPEPLSCSFYANCVDRWMPCAPHDNYALQYGRRYCHKFRGAMHSLTESGRRWLLRTMRCLQEAFVPVLLNHSLAVSTAAETMRASDSPRFRSHATKAAPATWDDIDAMADAIRIGAAHSLANGSYTTADAHRLCTELRQFGYDAHGACYTNQPYSVCELITPSLQDWREIVSVLEWSQVIEMIERRYLWEVVGLCVDLLL